MSDVWAECYTTKNMVPKIKLELHFDSTETALYSPMLKYAADLQDNTHAEVSDSIF